MCFIVCQAEGYQNISKPSCKPFAFISYKVFLKNKKTSGTSLPVSFSAWFLKKYVFLVMFCCLTKVHCLVTFTSWDIGQYVYCNYLLTWLWRHKFCSQLYLSNQAVPTWHKSQDKNLIILRTKRTFKMKWKSLFIIFKALSMKQITHLFLEVEIQTLMVLVG